MKLKDILRESTTVQTKAVPAPAINAIYKDMISISPLDSFQSKGDAKPSFREYDQDLVFGFTVPRPNEYHKVLFWQLSRRNGKWIVLVQGLHTKNKSKKYIPTAPISINQSVSTTSELTDKDILSAWKKAKSMYKEINDTIDVEYEGLLNREKEHWKSKNLNPKTSPRSSYE